MSTSGSGSSHSDHCESDGEVRAEIVRLVDRMTTTGQRTLDEKPVKAVKRLCRRSDEYVRHVFYLLMTRLEKDHAEVRLSAFQVARELFVRSHCFRDLLLSNFQQFLEVVLEINPKQPLPPPKWAAVELKQQAANAVNQWHESFGKTYKKLSIAYNFLKSSKKVDFASIDSAQHRLVQDRQRREEKNQFKLTKTLQEIEEAENCMTLLLSGHDMFNLAAADSAVSRNGTEAAVSCDSNNPTDMQQVDEEPACSSHLQSGCTDMSSATTIADSDSGMTSRDIGVISDKCHENVVQSLTSGTGWSDGRQTITDDEAGEAEIQRQHGVHSFRYALQIDVASHNIRIEQTDDNAVVISTLQDLTTLLLNRYTPTIKLWLEVLTKVGAAQEHVKKALDLKSSVESTVSRIQKLNIVSTNSQQSAASTSHAEDADSDDDSDFIEVATKEGFEPRIPEHRREEYGLEAASTLASAGMSWEQKDHQHDVEDPTSLVASVLKRRRLEHDNLAANCDNVSGCEHNVNDNIQPSTSATQPSADGDCHRHKHLQKAPVVPYGSDLYFWGDNVEPPLFFRNSNEGDSWWAKGREEAVDTNAVEASKSRVINFVGEFEPVKWKCRAPLPNGKLCQRMDRRKCPFHGKIVARDEEGVPVAEPHSSSTPQKTLPVDAASTWDDPELQTDILLATGVDLRRKDKRKRKQKRSETGLTDISCIQNNTARKRLASKVFDKKSLRRVADAMNAIDEKRAAEKFANTFRSTFRK